MIPSFDIPERIFAAYQRAIRNLIVPAYPKKKDDQTFEEWLAEISELSHRREIADAAALIAGKMVSWVNVENARTWRQAAARSQRSRFLFELLRREMQGPVGRRFDRLVKENAEYITRIPSDVSQKLTADIAKAQQAGARPETIAKFMRHKFPAMTKSRIQLIARTETMKSSSALTQARSEELDLPAYIWQTSEDSRVRESHSNMDGVIVLWRDPPSPEALIGERSTLGKYNVAQCPNCRCTPIVLLEIDDVRWPHRVYSHGAIRMMKRADFARLIGIPARRAA